jgi:serine/threonine-protein kinase HipA
MMMQNKCLYCYNDLGDEVDFHHKCALEFFGSKHAPKLEYTLDQMTELAKDVVERSVSVPGVQAKLSMSLVNDAHKQSDKRLTVVDALGGNYILKPPTDDFPEMPANEHLTMRLAELYGIKVVTSSLIKLKSGELAYVTKRIDRTADGGKIHMIDMFQITEAFDKYKSSMEKVGKAINSYSSNTLLDKLTLFELTIFSFITGNNDMHLKNFSMINTDFGWSLAPAYDLLNVAILIPDDLDELALTLNSKKRKLTKSDFDKFGSELGLSPKQINGVYKRFVKHQPKAIELIDQSFLSDGEKVKYVEVYQTRNETLSK